MLLGQITSHTEAGTDEAGRGCLAGPVTAAAVILPSDFDLPLLNDSKKLTENQRDALRPQIEKSAIAFSYAHVSPEEIDQINILNASIKAMYLALSQLHITPHFIAVDGNRFKPLDNIPYECVVKGDGKYRHIAAASILAKTHRDDYMKKIHTEFPQYGWAQNKGYPTKSHRKAIADFGVTSYHRKSFQLLPAQLSLPL
ncbi:MAG: ribonuclease HII [Flavobacteriaceae bacterium]|jgi:ribonuclease HII|nr:ribonuclease HII [Flavobacteriaceae bacterium]